MKGGSNIKPDNKLDTANIQGTDFSTNQQAVPVPWFVGERKISVRWVSPVYNQFTKEAPVERPGKK